MTATAARAGITKKVTAQILRDTCAVRLLNRGQPLERVLLKLGLNPNCHHQVHSPDYKGPLLRPSGGV